MNKKYSLFIAFFLVLLAFSCEDPDKSPILTFDKSGKGAYVRLIEETDRSFNFYNLGSADYKYSVSFVDENKGALITEYNIDVTFVDKTPANGNKSKGPVRFKSFKASDFETRSDGYKGLSNIVIKATDLISAVGLTTADVSATDVFQMNTSVTTQDGIVHNYDNSSASVNGSAFQSHFNFNLPLVCPSNLAGNYVATTTGKSTDDCCPNETTVDNIAVTLTAKGGGAYEISDWSTGLYLKWYGVYGITATTNLKATIIDVCGNISGSFDEPFGTKVTVTGTASGNTITYTWKNGYDDTATVTLVKK